MSVKKEVEEIPFHYPDHIQTVVLEIDKKNSKIKVKGEIRLKHEEREVLFEETKDLIFWVKDTADPKFKNESLNKIIDFLKIGDPIFLHWNNSENKTEGIQSYGYFILYPKVMLQASKLAGASKLENQAFPHPLFYFTNYFSLDHSSIPMLKGNFINIFFDSFFDNDSAYQTLNEKYLAAFIEATKSNIWQILNFNTEEKEQLKKGLFKIFTGLYAFSEQFKKRNLYTRVLVEPSFESLDYGLYGRVDFLAHQMQNQKDHIEKITKQLVIELKSGSLPYDRSNVPISMQKSIKISHAIQVKIYDLILRNIFKLSYKESDTAVLYASTKNGVTICNRYLKETHTVVKTADIVNFRNAIIILLKRIVDDKYPFPLLQQYAKQAAIITNHKSYAGKMAWVVKNLKIFSNIVGSVTHSQEDPQSFNKVAINAYICAFIQFTFTDYWYSHPCFQLEKKVKNFNEPETCLTNLQILPEELLKAKVLLKEITLHLSKKQSTEYPEFRIGDAITLQRELIKDNESSINQAQQLLKGIVEMIDEEKIRISFFKAQPKSYFSNIIYRWKIKPTYFESGFDAILKGLTYFTHLPDIRKKCKLIGLEAPDFYKLEKAHEQIINDEKLLPKSQSDYNRILQKVFSCKDYLLISGPPGTGKTKILIHNIVKHYIKGLTLNQEANKKPNAILLLGYTHRAVDEMYESCAQDPTLVNHMLRLSNESSIAMTFTKIDELKMTFSNKHILLGTVGKMNSLSSVFDFYNIELCIIDEASQILEHQIIGILSKVKKFVMIGDSMQLPAVCILEKEQTQVPKNNPYYEAMGLIDRSHSYFDRMSQLAQSKQWNWAFDQLTHQGRMHPLLMKFSNQYFYNNQLLSADIAHQKQENFFVKFKHPLCKRKLFIDVPITSKTPYPKVNTMEAQMIEQHLKTLFNQEVNDNGKIRKVTYNDVGIISPFRGQVAKIRACVQKAFGSKIIDELQIDTVERFQGGQKNIIIFSLTIHDKNHFSWIKSEVLTKENDLLDKKLNVVITRAKNQLVVFGNSAIIQEDPIYKRLYEWLI